MIAQLWTIIRKDFRLLLRSKSSTAAVLLGPLLVVLLVGLVFTNAEAPELVIGVYSEEFEQSQAYTQSLADAFTIIDYDDQRSCADGVRQGRIVSCVALENASPPRARIYVDPSDVNIVYAVIDRVTGQIENQSSMLRSGTTTQLLDAVTKTTLKLRQDAEQLREAQSILGEEQSKASTLSTELRDVQIDVRLVSRADVADAIDSSVNARDDYREISLAMLTDYEKLAERENRTKDVESALDYSDRLDDIEESLSGDEDKIFAELLSALQGLEQEVGESEQQAQALSSQAAQMKARLGQAKSDVDAVLSSIEQSRLQLASLDISSDDITRPIEPILEPVVAEEDAFGFAFPYFITLIIMFTAILLASTLIVRERTSSAYFRNFATPTPDWTFVLSTYLTTLVVLAVQIIIIFGVAALFINIPLTLSIGTTILLLLLVVTFFTLLGMLLGYTFRNQEGVMLAAIAVAALLLFVSSMVLPVKTMPPAVQFIIGANPFVLSAELLKASIIFGFAVPQVIALILVLVLYCVALFALIMIVQRLTRVRYFELGAASGRISDFLTDQEISSEKALVLGDDSVHSKRELLGVLKEMSDEDYEQYATHRHNEFADWIRDVYKDEKLADRLRNKSRKGAVAVLEKELK